MIFLINFYEDFRASNLLSEKVQKQLVQDVLRGTRFKKEDRATVDKLEYSHMIKKELYENYIPDDCTKEIEQHDFYQFFFFLNNFYFQIKEFGYINHPALNKLIETTKTTFVGDLDIDLTSFGTILDERNKAIMENTL